MEKPKNPYVIGNSVGNSPAFVGRDDVLRDVLHVLRHHQQNAIVLFGQRRIGKTSVLRELEVKLPQQGPFLPVFFDLQDKAKWPLDRVLRELAHKITDSVPNGNSDLGNDPEKAFRNEWLPNIIKNLPAEKSLVLLFDEFDVMAISDEVEQANAVFFPYLRGLLEEIKPQHLNFVFAIGRDIKDLDKNTLSLFKGVITKRVSLLDRDDTVKLIRFSKANNTLKWSEEAIGQVWRQTNGHPLITQCLCHDIWNAAYTNEPEQVPKITLEKVEAAIPKNTLESISSAINWLWEGLGAAERLVMSTLASAGVKPMTEAQINALLKESAVQVIIPELENAPNLLNDWDLIEPAKSGGYRFRIELLRRWVEEREPISRVRQEIDNINPEATESYRTGIELKDREQLDEACERLRDAIDKNPNHAKASDLLANILLDQGKIEDSCQEMENLYKYQPVAVQDRFIQRLLDLAKNEKDEDKQLELFGQILNLDPDCEKVKTFLEQKGDKAYEAAELKTALKYYQKAGTDYKVIEVQWTIQCQALPSEKIHNWYEQAKIARKNRDTQKAQSLFTRILAKEPTHKEAIQDLYSMNMPVRSKWSLPVIALVIGSSIISIIWLLFQNQAIQQELIIAQGKLSQNQTIQQELIIAQNKLSQNQTIQQELIIAQDKLKSQNQTIQQELIIAQDKLKRFEDLPNRLEKFVPKLQQGLYAVVVGSYGDKFEGVAQKEVEKIQQRYPILGAGKFQIPDEDESWLVHLGNFYTRESAEQLEDKATNELNFDEVSIVETRKIAKKDREDIASTEDFASTLKKGTSVVVVSSYGRSFNVLAQKAVEKLQKLHPTLGAGKFLDGEFWIVHLGQFYAKESAKQLIEKAQKDWNFHDAFVLNTGRTNIPPPPDGGTNIPPPESQKTLPEFLETLKEGSYVIVVQTYGSRFEKYARNLVAQLNDNHPKLEADKFKIGSQWLVSIGKGYSRESAQALKQYAIAHKIVEDAYIRKR